MDWQDAVDHTVPETCPGGHKRHTGEAFISHVPVMGWSFSVSYQCDICLYSNYGQIGFKQRPREIKDTAGHRLKLVNINVSDKFTGSKPAPRKKSGFFSRIFGK